MDVSAAKKITVGKIEKINTFPKFSALTKSPNKNLVPSIVKSRILTKTFPAPSNSIFTQEILRTPTARIN